MDLKEIRQIVELMKKNGLTVFEMEEEGRKLALKRGPDTEAIQEILRSLPAAAPAPPPAAANPGPGAVEAADPEVSGLLEINSPMVGTFYRSPSPDANPFVKIGSEVTEETTVCIVEAMKVMNDIQSEVSGKIVEILVDDTTPVQYGEPLFRVKPL